ncbi:MAG: cyclase family protein [archaeon]|jgi:kynurenine formamidase
MAKKLIDLTQKMDEVFPEWMFEEKQEIKQSATIEKEGYNEKRISITTHFATHIDAPFHMIRDGKKLHEYPLETFTGSAIVIPLKNFEKYLNKIKKNDIVLIYTGQGKKFYNQDYYASSPVVSESIAKELVKRKVKIVGIDAFSPDKSPWNVHKILFEKSILIIENMLIPSKLIGKRFECSAYTTPVGRFDEDGAPCRVIAKV